MDSEKQYEVGFGKPPEHTRFRKGTSGNPNGRPRRSLAIDDLVDRELDEKIRVQENGKTRRLSKRQLLAKQRVRLALSGDRHALQWAFDFMRTRTKPPMFEIDPEDEIAFQSLVAEQKLLKEYLDGPDVARS